MTKQKPGRHYPRFRLVSWPLPRREEYRGLSHRDYVPGSEGPYKGGTSPTCRGQLIGFRLVRDDEKEGG